MYEDWAFSYTRRFICKVSRYFHFESTWDALSKLAFSIKEHVEFVFDVTPYILDTGDPTDPLALLVSAEGVAL